MQWAVSIGRMDVQTAVISIFSFREQSCVGHFEHLKRMVGFLTSFLDYNIRFCTNKPNLSGVSPISDHDLKYTPYENSKEDLSLDVPPLRGKCVILSHCFDENFMHDVLSGKLVTGVVHFWNETLMDWYSKRQTTSKTATYSSKFLSGHTCFEQFIDHRNYICYLGVLIHDISFSWGDNN